MKKIYICNRDFPKLGLEEGDVFPVERFTEEAVLKALDNKEIIEETLEFD